MSAFVPAAVFFAVQDTVAYVTKPSGPPDSSAYMWAGYAVTAAAYGGYLVVPATPTPKLLGLSRQPRQTKRFALQNALNPKLQLVGGRASPRSFHFGRVEQCAATALTSGLPGESSPSSG